MTTNLEVVQAVYEAFKRQDLATLLAAFDSSAEIDQSELVPWGGRYRGLEGVRSFLGALMSHVESVVEVEEIFDAGDRIVQIGRSRGRVHATGSEFDTREVHIWKVREGKIVDLKIFLDLPAMLALGR